MNDDGNKPKNSESCTYEKYIKEQYDRVVEMHDKGEYISAADLLIDILIECLEAEDFDLAEQLVARMADDAKNDEPETTHVEGLARSISVLGLTKRHNRKIPSRRRLIEELLRQREAAGRTNNGSLQFYDQEQSIVAEVLIGVQARSISEAKVMVTNAIAKLCRDEEWSVSGTVEGVLQEQESQERLAVRVAIRNTWAIITLACGVVAYTEARKVSYLKTKTSSQGNVPKKITRKDLQVDAAGLEYRSR